MRSSDYTDFDEHLLRFLREELQEPKLCYSEPLVPIPGGAGVQVFGFRLGAAPAGLAQPLVVRVWRTSDARDAASFESCLQNTLAELGYPVPKVLACCDDPAWLGSPFQVMERASGAPLLRVGNNDSADASPLAQVVPDLGRLFFRNWPRRLARLHAQLHGLDAERLLQVLEARGLDPSRVRLAATLDRLEATIQAYELKGLSLGIEWLRAHAPREDERLAICHGDFFANQIFVERNHSTVLDWSEVLVAPAEIDVGIVCCGIRTLPVALPRPFQRAGLEVQRWLARRFLSAYRALRPIDADLMRVGGVFRALQTLVGVSVRRLALARAIAEEPGPNPYDSPLGVELLRRYLESAASVQVELPDPHAGRRCS